MTPPSCLLPAPLSAAQLRRLEEHRYSAAGRSLLEPPLQLFWGWLLERVPLWLAPNTITSGGLLVNVLSTLLLVYYCPTATEEAPWWVFLLCAVGLFIYQSLDAIDGKQARRTNSSSPLGELFDHGCDAISTVFVAVGTTVACRLGTHPDWLFFCNFVGMFMFYCAHWQTYVSGTLRFGKLDVTEAQLSIILVFLLSAFGGTRLWDIQIPMVGLPLKTFPVLGIVIGALFSCCNYFIVIFTGGVGKNGSTVAGTSVLSPGLHIGLALILAVMIYKKSPTALFQRHPCLYTFAVGFVCAKVANKLVVAHMSKSELHLPDTAFIGPGLLFLNQYFNGFVNEYIVLWVALIISLVDLLRYCTGVCIQIAEHLQMHIFSIPSLPAPEQKAEEADVTSQCDKRKLGLSDTTVEEAHAGDPLLQVEVTPSVNHQNSMD